MVDERTLTENVAIQSMDRECVSPGQTVANRSVAAASGDLLDVVVRVEGMIPSWQDSMLRSKSATSPAPKTASARSPLKRFMRAAKLPTICLPGGNSFSIILRLQTLTSSGVCGEPSSSNLIWPGLRTATAISTASKTGRACKRRWRTRRRCRPSSPKPRLRQLPFHFNGEAARNHDRRFTRRRTRRRCP